MATIKPPATSWKEMFVSPVATLTAAVMHIAIQVANPLRILSAYFITNAITSPSLAENIIASQALRSKSNAAKGSAVLSITVPEARITHRNAISTFIVLQVKRAHMCECMCCT